MKQTKIKLSIISLVAITFFSVSGNTASTINVEINEIGTFPHPLFNPLPIKVGVYYGNDFGTFQARLKEDGVFIKPLYIYNIKMGKANIALFDYILSNVFEKVTSLNFLPKEFNHIKDIDLIIEPTIHNFEISTTTTYISEMSGTVVRAYINLTYEINFYLPGGEKIGFWRIQGRERILQNSTEATQKVMRQIAAKFMTDFCNQTVINKLFYNECGQCSTN
jgi:hypothetical protein